MNTELTPVEQLMLKKQQEREQKAASNFFANKTNPRPAKYSPLLNEKICSGPKRKITIRHYKGYQNTFYYMLDQFEIFKGLLYDDSFGPETEKKKQELISIYKNKVNFAGRTISTHEDDEIWTILERKFRRDYYQLYKAKNKS